MTSTDLQPERLGHVTPLAWITKKCCLSLVLLASLQTGPKIKLTLHVALFIFWGIKVTKNCGFIVHDRISFKHFTPNIHDFILIFSGRVEVLVNGIKCT
jgi:hypothetical protein